MQEREHGKRELKHKTLTEFLQLLGLDNETVNREVEDIEHHLRPETVVLFSRLVGFWRAHPAQLEAFKTYSRRLS